MKFGRLAITAVLVTLAIFLLVGPGLRWVMLNEFQRELGFEIRPQGSTRVSLDGNVVAHDLYIGHRSDDDQSMRTTFTRIDRLQMRLSPSQFLKRQMRVESALLQGVHLHATEPPTGTLGTLAKKGSPHARNWLPSGILGGDSHDVWREFQDTTSIEEEAEKVEEKWNASIEALKLEHDAIEKRVAALRQNSNAGLNALRDQPLLEQRMLEAKELHDLLVRFQKKLENAEFDMKQQRQQVRQAQEGDLHKLASQRNAIGIDAKAVSRSILIEIARSTLARLEHDVQSISGQAISSHTIPFSHRGDTSVLNEYSELGSVSLHSAKWEGEILQGDEQLEWTGTIQGMSSHSENAQGKAKFQATAKSKDKEIHVMGMQLHPVTNGWDTYEVQAPNYGHAMWVLENQQGLALHGKGKPMKVQIRQFQSDQMPRREVHIEQHGLTMTFHGKRDEASQRIASVLTQTLQQIPELQLTAEVEGDPAKDDHWRIECNLDGVLEEGLRDAFRSEIAMHETTIRDKYKAITAQIESRMEQVVQIAKKDLQQKNELAKRSLAEWSHANLPGAIDSDTRFARQPSTTLQR